MMFRSRFPQGQAFCLLGRSGTGKSVALRHIIGLVKADSGSVFVEGFDITTMHGRQLADVRKHMGVLFQNAALFDSMSVGDNVAFPMRRHTDWSDADIRKRAMAKLTDVGLEEDFDTMPGDLSGGMKKRAGLARAMALDPVDPAGGRAERRPRSDDIARDRRTARQDEAGRDHARRGHAQHSERACDR